MDWRAARRTLPTAASRCWSAVTRPPSQASWPLCGGHTCRVGWIRSRSTHRQAGRSSTPGPPAATWTCDTGRPRSTGAVPAETSRGRRSRHRQDDRLQADPIAGGAERLVGPLELGRACDDRRDLGLDLDLDLALADQRPGQATSSRTPPSVGPPTDDDAREVVPEHQWPTACSRATFIVRRLIVVDPDGCAPTPVSPGKRVPRSPRTTRRAR